MDFILRLVVLLISLDKLFNSVEEVKKMMVTMLTLIIKWFSWRN